MAAARTALLGGRASEAAAHRSLAEAGLEAGLEAAGLGLKSRTFTSSASFQPILSS